MGEYSRNNIPPPGQTRRSTWLAGALLGLGLSGCSLAPMQDFATEINKTRADAEFFLLPGDQVDVKFPRKPEWDHATTIRTDGRASFHFCGELQVAGLTMEKLSEALRNRLHASGAVVSDDITVNLLQVSPRLAVVIGEVGAPGTVPIDGRGLSLVEAIAKAGGPAKGTALLSETMLIRWIPKEGRQQVWHMDASREHWGVGSPIFLQPHDIVFVPNNTIDKLNVWVDKHIRQLMPIPIGVLPIGN